MLAMTNVGVVALSMRALPMAFPVTFALLDDDIIVRTSTGGSLLAQMTDHVVTLIAYDPPALGSQATWSVAVTGRAHVIVDPAQLSDCRALLLPACSPADSYLRIPLDIVVGEERSV